MIQVRDVERAPQHGDLRWAGHEWRRWDVGNDWQTRALALAVEDEVTENRVRLEVDRYGNVWATPVRHA